MNITIANISTSITDAVFQTVIAAIGRQVTDHFQPEWGLAAKLTGTKASIKDKAVIQGNHDAIVYLGDSSQDPTTGVANALGYHSVTYQKVAYGFVYLDICAEYDENWTVTLSHEVLELLADPDAVMTVTGPAPNGAPGTVYYDLEVADPTQGDSYQINGVSVSNFVGRSYFNMTGGSNKTNYLNLELAPFGVRPGGYFQYEDAVGAHQIQGEKVTSRQLAAKKLMEEGRRNPRRIERIRGQSIDITPKPASPARNVLVFVHGVVLDQAASNHTHQYTDFYNVITNIKPRILIEMPLATNVAMVEWGHWPLPGTGALSDDERITGAENTILEATRYDRVKANATSDDSFLGFAPDTPGRLLVQPFTRPLKERLITLGLTDTIYYTTVEGETAVRRTAYSQIFDYLERYRGSEHINIHLIGHSQGATIAYDLLFGLFADAAAYGGNPPGYYSQASNDTERERFDYWRKRAQSGTLILGSFATFGSQLALMTMRKQRTVDSLANGYRLDPAVIGIEPTSVATKWKHFYDQDDVLGYPVRHLFNSLPGTFKEYEVDSNWNPLDSHSDYWICPQVQHEVATMIEANL